MDLRRTLRVSVREVIFPHVRLVILYDLPLKFFLLFPKKIGGMFILHSFISIFSLPLQVILVFFLMRDAMSWRNQQRPTHWWLRSHFRLKMPCKGGNLMKIDTNQCTVSNGKQKCEAKCNGWYTKHPTTSK